MIYRLMFQNKPNLAKWWSKLVKLIKSTVTISRLVVEQGGKEDGGRGGVRGGAAGVGGDDEVGVEDVGAGRVELGVIRPQRRPRVPQQEHLAAGDVGLGM